MTQFLPVINRISAALLGGYVFTWGFTALGIASLVALGVDFHEAETGILLFAFLVFLVIFLWVFAAKNMIKVWGILVVGALAMLGTAIFLQNQLMS